MSVSQLFQPNSYNLFCNSLTANEVNTSTTGNNSQREVSSTPQAIIGDGSYYPVGAAVNFVRSSLEKDIYITATIPVTVDPNTEVFINIRRSTIGLSPVSELLVPQGIIKIYEDSKYFTLTWLELASSTLTGDYNELDLVYEIVYSVDEGTSGTFNPGNLSSSLVVMEV